MSWQEEVRRRAGQYGLTVTSGYRSPAHNRAIGGSETSYHMEGTREAPGAIDIGGPAEGLKRLFDDLYRTFKGRIKELYLNIPGGTSEAIKGDNRLSYNPEAGRKRHLHVAIGGTGGGTRGKPYSSTDIGERGIEGSGGVTNKGDKAMECSARIQLLPRISRIMENPPYVCWSDIWFYGSGTLLAILGLIMLFAAGRENASK